MVKSNQDAPNLYFSSIVLRKLKIPTPATRVVQSGEVDYTNLHIACERVSRLDENLQAIVGFHLNL